MRSMLWLLLTLILVVACTALGRKLRRSAPPREPPPEGPCGPDPDYEREIGDELDLHGVPEAQVEELVDAFVEVAVDRGRARVKIVHGKGTGRLRQRVRARLARHPAVVAYEDAATPGSGWGATVVHLGTRCSEVAPEPPPV